MFILVILLTAIPVDAPAQKWIGRAVRSGVLRGWSGVRHKLFKPKIKRTQGDLKRLAKHIGLKKKKLPVFITSNAERRLHGSLIQEARSLKGARPGTWAHRRLQSVKKQLRKLGRRRRFTRGVPKGSSASTNGKMLVIHADQRNRLLPDLAHELRHVRDIEKGMVDEVVNASPEVQWKRRALMEVRAEGTGSYALGLTRKPIEGHHMRYYTGTQHDSVYPPLASAKASIKGYLNGVTRALAGRFKDASQGALSMADAYLAGYEEVLVQQAEHALGQPPLDPAKAPKLSKKQQLKSWLAFKKFQGKRAHRRWAQRTKQRGQRLGDPMAAYNAGFEDAAFDTPPHARLEAILSGKTGPVSMPPSPPSMSPPPSMPQQQEKRHGR